jgi:Smg protein
MNENVLDVLMYLFEHSIDEESEEEPDRAELERHLDEAGFAQGEIDRALGWLDRLMSETPLAARGGDGAAQRIYADEERKRLNTDARGFLLHLEQNGLLTAGTRELILDRVMELDAEEIDLDQLRWVVLMVLFNQPDDSIAYSRLEEVMRTESGPAALDYLH